jgi:uncharacterized phosphosugar-binding protein
MTQRQPALYAGWATRDITPNVPIRLGGYGPEPTIGRHVHDSLEARALALSDGTCHAVIVVADLIQVDSRLAEMVRARVREKCPAALQLLIWVAATHTHGGPYLGDSVVPHASSAVIDPAALADHLADAAVEAITGEQTVTARWTSGPVDQVAGNRDHPDTISDISLDLLLLYKSDQDARPSAVLGSFPAHPTVLGAANDAVTADLPGAFRQALGHRFAEAGDGSAPWITLATGAAGDISTRHTRRGQDFAELARLGGVLAGRAWELIGKAERIIPTGEPLIEQWLTRNVPMEIKRFPSESELTDYEENLRREQAEARAAGDEGLVRTLHTALQGTARVREIMDQAKGLQLTAEIAALRLGPLSLVAVPGELYNELGTKLRRTTGGPVMVIGYCNGHVGYLPTAASYERPDYEVFSSLIAPGNAERLVDRLEEALHLLFAEHAPDLVSEFGQAIVERVQGITRYQHTSISLAGNLIADTIVRGGMVFTLGTGHSHILAEEIFSRASCIFPVQPLQSAALMIHEDVDASGAWEQLPGAARILLEYSRIQSGDLLIVISNSGRNAVPVEAAEWARAQGIPVIAVTSLRHSSSVTSLAPSGKRLFEVADLVLDNQGKPGDTLLEFGDGLGLGPSSTALGAVIMHAMVVSAVAELVRRGVPPPVMQSSNVPGSDLVNGRQLLAYTGRLPEVHERHRERFRRQTTSAQSEPAR